MIAPKNAEIADERKATLTVSQAYQKALSLLIGNGIERAEAQATARLLLDECVGGIHAHLVRGEEVLTASQQQRFETALVELERGRPLAYILGKWEFYGIELLCDERALIPRPETELLVEFALSQIAAGGSAASLFRIADLGTGSGCIPVALAKNSATVELYASDAAPAALALAQENAHLHDVESRIHFVTGILGNWAAPLQKYAGSFDVIVSNPPYIPPREIETLQTQVRDFEPSSALDGGLDGLDCYRQIAQQCQVLLKSSGVLACELGAGQFEETRALFEAQQWRVEEPTLDWAGIARVLVARPRL